MKLVDGLVLFILQQQCGEPRSGSLTAKRQH